MLNRRLARIRAMQALYALEKSKGANFLLAQDLIAEAFAPNLNSMEKQDRNKLSGLVKLSQSLFEDETKKGIFTFDDGTPVEIRSILSKAREFLKHKNKKDFDFHSLQTILDAERTYDVYLYILNMLVLLGNKPDSVLYSNRVIKSLSLNKDLEVISLKRSVSLENKTVEDDLAVVKYLVKNVILKHEITNDFFEKLHIFWSEDRDILRTMVFHTFNDFIDTQEVHIEKLEEQWEETKDFLRVLFKETAANNEEHQRLIMPHIKNWDVERIIETDLILLKMAITEWTHFNSIPVKVTINEIIEISKNYSSEKSKIFINGVLDSLYKDLNGQNLIKKTGRGMLDNK
jgi:N utilization substance protein B